MIQSMVRDTQELLVIASDTKISDETLTNCLIQGTKSKKYIPLLKRPKCGKMGNLFNNCISHTVGFRKFRISRTTAP